MNEWTEPPPRFGARLACGHETKASGRPTPGTWMSCGACHDQRPISLSWALGVPGVGQQGVQGELWTAGEAA